MSLLLISLLLRVIYNFSPRHLLKLFAIGALVNYTFRTVIPICGLFLPFAISFYEDVIRLMTFHYRCWAWA